MMHFNRFRLFNFHAWMLNFSVQLLCVQLRDVYFSCHKMWGLKLWKATNSKRVINLLNEIKLWFHNFANGAEFSVLIRKFRLVRFLFDLLMKKTRKMSKHFKIVEPINSQSLLKTHTLPSSFCFEFMRNLPICEDWKISFINA